jgi:iron(III) transport system substrate-binding protein
MKRLPNLGAGGSTARAALVAAAILAVAGCGGASGGGAANPQSSNEPSAACANAGACDPPAAILDKARSEGQVVIYSALGSATSTALGQAFEQKYGIKLVATEVTQADSLQRIQSEADAGKRTADFVPLGDPGTFATWEQDGVIDKASVKDIPNLAVLPKDLYKDGYYFMWGGAVYTLGYNTARSPGGTPPTGYCELTDPKWKGLVGLTFQPGATTFVHYDMIRQACGQDYFKKLKDNGVKLFPSTSNATQSLAAGEYGALLSTVPYILTPFKDKGAPVGFALPKEGITVSTRWGALVKDAPHPNAAKVFVNFLLSVDAQKIAYTGGNLGYSVLPQSALPDSLHPTGKVAFADVTAAKKVEPSIAADLGR